MDPTKQGLLTQRRERRPDDTLTPLLKRPWVRWDVDNRADTIAAVLLAVIIALAAGPLFFDGGSQWAVPRSFPIFGPLVAVLPFVALLAMFANRERGGFVRVLLALSAAAFGGAAIGFAGRAPIWQLVLFYLVPAVISIGVAILLTVRQKTARQVEARAAGRGG